MSEVSPKIPPSDGNKSDLSMLPLEKTGKLLDKKMKT